MANEIAVSAALSATKGGVDVSTTTSLSLNMAGDDMVDITQLINTGANGEILMLVDITAPAGYIHVKNLDPTNFVLLASDANFTANVSTFAKLLPGGIALFPPACNIYAKSDTNVCRIAMTAVEA